MLGASGPSAWALRSHLSRRDILRWQQAFPLLLDLSCCELESDSTGLFDPVEPTGEYKLDAALPYARMVISELLALSEAKRGYEVRGKRAREHALKIVPELEVGQPLAA